MPVKGRQKLEKQREDRQEEREWDKEEVSNRDLERGKRQDWGWWWLWSHREAIETSRENELCVLGPGAELGTPLGKEGTQQK